jgi:hypothetical protein
VFAVLAALFDAAHLAFLLLDLALALGQANGPGPEVRKTKLLTIPPTNRRHYRLRKSNP